MSNVDHPASTEHVRLIVPELAARPYAGAGCCAVAATDLVDEALSGLRGIRRVTSDERTGQIDVELDPGTASQLLPTIRAVLDGIGYPITEVRS